MSRVLVNKLSLRNFRCFNPLELTNLNRSVCIVGPNGTGKTSILEAISLLSPGRGIRSAPHASMAAIGSEERWKISSELKIGEGEHLLIDTYLNSGNTRKVLIWDKAVRQTKLSEVLKVLWISPLMDRIWTDGPEGRRKLLDRFTMNLFPTHPSISNGYQKALRERNLLLRDQSNDEGWYNGLEERMATFGSELTQNRVQTLQMISESLKQSKQEVFPELEVVYPESSMEQRDYSYKNNLLDLWKSTRDKDMRSGRTMEGPHRVDLEVTCKPKGITARLSSTGEQKILLLSLTMATARSIKEHYGMAPILLLDEFFAHLDPENRKLLTAEIQEMQSQVWMTGTDPEVFQNLAGDFIMIQGPEFQLNLS